MIFRTPKWHRRVSIVLLAVQVSALVVQAVGLPAAPALAEPAAGPESSMVGLAGAEAAALPSASPLGPFRMMPGEQLTISPATAARLKIQLAQAEAILAEAKLRVQQAQSGQGGLGARTDAISA